MNYILKLRYAINTWIYGQYYNFCLRHGFYRHLADMNYKKVFGRSIDWKNPRDLNEWIHFLEFKTDTTIWSRLADKYAMRKWVEEKGFGEYLVPLLGKWNTPEEIDFDSLPDSFVLKLNNGSGDAVIVSSGGVKCIDKQRVIGAFRHGFDYNFGLVNLEPHYLRIEPCVIAEKYLDSAKQDYQSSSMIDYKFFCFNGNVVACWVISNRVRPIMDMSLYDTDWKDISNERLVYDSQHRRAKGQIPKPHNLERMIEIASSLSSGFVQVRVDFYEVNGVLYLGELTFTSNAGIANPFTEDYLRELGEHCAQAYKALSS